ncbi:MAG: type VI secretion system membrane subunit TssM [Deltaproteobacteria bacterium]|nr:type VI secretion system membrane subunit TssM [Deltaproteobacteria bacterium]
MLAVILSVVLLAALWAVVLLLKLPLWIAILVTALLVLGWIGLLVWRRLRARKAAGEIENALRGQASEQASMARPDQQADIEAMQAEFDKAIAALKGSKLSRGGKDALGILPWYMIIGPPGAGKSTALRASGLKFPYLTKRGGVRGVGGTRNCEWWLTNDAVLLDTAGRYATEEEDREEWFTFLDTLKKARKRKPVNGLIVAVSVADLAEGTPEQGGELGALMRERVDEVLSRLGVVLPVYVLFTKCDLLPGFVESFSDLRKAERGQVWGFTVPLSEHRERAEVVREYLDELLATLEERSLWRMGDERQIEARERIHAFPQQIDALSEAAVSFVDALFTENVYQDTPILRGVYFTSGTQEGRTIDRVMASMAEAFGVRPQVAAPEPVLEAKSYFLRELFSKVMFPDQNIAVRSAKARKSDRTRQIGLLAGAALLLFVCLFFPVRSFLLNRELALRAGEAADAVAERIAAPPAPNQSPVEKLESLRAVLADLVRWEEQGAPFSMRFGMYQGSTLLPHVRKLHAAAVRRLVLDPIFKQDVEEMDAFVRRFEGSGANPSPADHARFYERLKMHLLLTAPRGLAEPRIGDAEQAWLGAQVAERWTRRWSLAASPAGSDQLSGNAALYARLLAGDPTLALPRYEDLVRRIRRVLQRLPVSSLMLEKLLAAADGKGYELNLQGVLGGPLPALRSTGQVRGAFTRRGYDEVMKARLDNPAGLFEPWVLAAEGADAEAQQQRDLQRLQSLYYARYIQEWKRFLESVELQVPVGSGATLSLLQDLTRGEPPPYARLFRSIGYNTRIAGALAAVEEGVVDKLRRSLGATPAGAAAARAAAGARDDREEKAIGPKDVEKTFAGFAGFGYGPDAAAAAAAAASGAPPPAKNLPLDVWQEQMVFVRDALQTATESSDSGPLLGRVQAARTRIRALIDTQELGWRPYLERLLWPPIEAASAGAAREAAAGASQKWCATVANPWRRTLANRYPFNRDGDDSALADVVEFFRPGSGLVWGFYAEALKADVQRAGDGFTFARQMGGASGFRTDLLAFLKRAAEITTVLFPANASEPAVGFSVRIRPTPKVAAVILEVDGQRYEYNNGPEEWRKMTWPAQGKSPGALIKVRTAQGREEVLQQDGEWGLFRLLEAGQPKGEPGLRDFAMSFSFPSLGVAVVMDFRPARSEAPFFGVPRGGKPRLMAPFRGGFTVPAAIGRGGPPCF